MGQTLSSISFSQASSCPWEDPTLCPSHFAKELCSVRDYFHVT